MILPFKAAAAFIASPQGRRAIKKARERFDTPENRDRALAAMKDVRARLGQRSGRPASTPPAGRS